MFKRLSDTEFPDIEFKWGTEDVLRPCLSGMEKAEKLKRWGDSIARAAEKNMVEQIKAEVEKIARIDDLDKKSQGVTSLLFHLWKTLEGK